jgi:hypothetical protein
MAITLANKVIKTGGGGYFYRKNECGLTRTNESKLVKIRGLCNELCVLKIKIFAAQHEIPEVLERHVIIKYKFLNITFMKKVEKIVGYRYYLFGILPLWGIKRIDGY